jgi:AraC-like DNA-binding protein
LADVACLSPSALSRLFRQATRMTIGDYLTRLRIGRACALLIEGDLPVTHVAEEAGYNNLSNFNRQFKAEKSMTPRAFRRLHRA